MPPFPHQRPIIPSWPQLKSICYLKALINRVGPRRYSEKLTDYISKLSFRLLGVRLGEFHWWWYVVVTGPEQKVHLSGKKDSPTM